MRHRAVGQGRRCRLTAGLLAALLAAGAAGCAGEEPIGPSPAPTASETSPAPSPTPTGSPTPSFGLREQEAITEAEAAYRKWIAVTDRLKTAANKLTEKQREELYTVGGDPAADDMNDFLIRYGEGGIVQKGALVIVSIAPTGVNLKVPKGDYPEVRLRACVDNSKVSFVYASSGKPASSPVGSPRFVMPIKAWFYSNTWHIVEAGTGSEREEC